jgi:hypothetical protein
MTQYLLTIQQPDGPPPPPDVLDMEQVMDDVHGVLDQLKADGSWVFNGGLHPPGTATVVRIRGGEPLTTDGPYTEGKEHIGGICVIDVPDLDVALGWATKLSRATRLPIEVRPFQEASR